MLIQIGVAQGGFPLSKSSITSISLRAVIFCTYPAARTRQDEALEVLTSYIDGKQEPARCKFPHLIADLTSSNTSSVVIIWSNRHTSQLSHPRTKKSQKNLKLFTAKATRRFTQHAAEWALEGKNRNMQPKQTAVKKCQK